MIKLLIAIGLVVMFLAPVAARADIKWVDGYSRGDGTPVRGYYRDTSNDGQSWNNANNNGYNGH